MSTQPTCPNCGKIMDPCRAFGCDNHYCNDCREEYANICQKCYHQLDNMYDDYDYDQEDNINSSHSDYED